MVDPSSIGRYIKALTYPDSLNGKKPEVQPGENDGASEGSKEEKRNPQVSGENGNGRQ
jgi:hypothetical protein